MDEVRIIQNDKMGDSGSIPLSGGTQESLVIHSTGKAHMRRGGRGGKASPELTRAVHDVRASEERLKHDIARLNGDKERLTEQVRDLEQRLVTAKEEGLLKSTVKRLEALLTEAHDKLNILEGVLPERSISRDRVLMEEVLKKWHEYDRERTNQARAESKINQFPEDKRAEGDINRARTAAYALKEEINSLVKQGDLIVENDMPNPVHDEWISYTNEQAIIDAEEFAKKHKGNTGASSVSQEGEAKNLETTTEADTTPTIATPEEQLSSQTTNERTLNETYLAPISDIHPATLDVDIHPLINSKIEDNTQQQLETIYKKEALEQPEILHTPLIVPEEAHTDANVATEKNAPPLPSVSPSTADEQPPAFSLSQETTPTDPKTLAYANQQMNDHLDTLFGKKGLFGLRTKKGSNSTNWKDPHVGFANKTVTQILEIKTGALTNDGTKYFGVEDPTATDKMQKYLQFARTETGVEPLPEEKVGDYLLRASSIAIGKYLKKG